MFHFLLSDVFSIKLYQFFIGRDADIPGHGKDVVDGFNAVQKRYLATFLRICSTPKVDKIDSKSIHVDAITKKGEVRFAEECKRLMYFLMNLVTRVIRNMQTAKLKYA